MSGERSGLGQATPELRIDLAAIAGNTRTIAARTRGEVMAVVKADGFGHGAADVAATALANGASSLGVTGIDEALRLREAGITAPILSWLNAPGADFAAATAADVEIAIPSCLHLARVAAAAPGAAVHLHLDVGMARDGAPASEWAELCAAAARLEASGRLRVAGIMGHMGLAEAPGHPGNAVARERFATGVSAARAAGLRPRHTHLAATAATLHDPASHHTMSRIGAGLFGIDPAGIERLRPALSLHAPVVAVRDVPAETIVGYGGSHRTHAATRLALLPLGYADGLSRAASEAAEVWLAGARRRVVGLISMDQTVVDIGDAPVKAGDTATIFGAGDGGEPTAAEWAAWSGTIEHEIVTRIGQRVHRTARSATGTEHLTTTTPATAQDADGHDRKRTA